MSGKERIDDNVLEWYGQFSHDPKTIRDHIMPNFFIKVDEKVLSSFLELFGERVPSCYIYFLKRIGEGRLTLDRNGVQTDDYQNAFLGPSEIYEILSKKSEEWKVYKDFIADDEFPFFYTADNSVLVFRRNCGSRVYFPYLDIVYAESFGEFLYKLMNNINFYHEL